MKRRKSNVPDFANEFYKGETLGSIASPYVPNLPIKYRGSVIQLKGAKVRTEDFTKFVKRGGSFVPAMCDQPSEGETVYDFAPLLNVGAAELIVMLNYSTSACSRKYLDWCHNLEFSKNLPAMLDKGRDFLQADLDDVTTLATAVRSGLIDGRFPEVRRVYRTLMALKIVNPQSYCMALMDAVRIVFALTMTYISEDLFDAATRYYRCDEKSVYMGIVVRKLFQFKAVHYGPLFSGRTISDCRGLGINLFCMFMLHVYNKFAIFESNGVQEVFKRYSTMSRLQDSFNLCIGTDAVGRYLKDGVWETHEVPESVAVLAEQAGATCLDGHLPDTMTLVPTDSGVSFVDGFWHMVAGRDFTQLPVGRGLCESSILWCSAVGLESRRPRGYVIPMDCYYATKQDIVHSFLDFALSKRGVKLQTKLESANREVLMQELMNRIGADKLRERVTKEAESKARTEVVSLKRQVETLTAELESLRRIKRKNDDLVVSKQEVIDGLRAEVSDLRAKVRNMYEVDDIDEEVVDSSVSAEDMLAFVNQFRLIIVGGIDSMRFRLESAGFTNFYICASKYQNGSMDAVGDFYCICTKFISHQEVMYLEAKHNDQLSQFFYFNGTNVDVLLRTSYEFIKGWFESNDGKMDNPETLS